MGHPVYLFITFQIRELRQIHKQTQRKIYKEIQKSIQKQTRTNNEANKYTYVTCNIKYFLKNNHLYKHIRTNTQTDTNTHTKTKN